MRVLSLFDGISCGHVALERAGIPVEVYYASEIDKYAIQITQKNYPNTIQLGDINNIDFTQFIGKIDLIMGGSPCQDLSIAGKRAGLQGERSGLFYKFVEAIETIKPKYFLLENNVGMPQEAYEEISRLMGCYPIMINSALVSAQTRKRFYWTNIGPQEYNLFGFPTVAMPQPENKGILLKDVLESDTTYQEKSYVVCANEHKGTTLKDNLEKHRRTLVFELVKIPEATKRGYVEISPGECVDLTHINSKSRRGRAMFEKSDAVTTQPNFYQYIGKLTTSNKIYSIKNRIVKIDEKYYKLDLPDGEYLIRKLMPLECERLQTLPDNYSKYGINRKMSNLQRYKCIGNGWTVDVIAHIFSFMEGECGKQ